MELQNGTNGGSFTLFDYLKGKVADYTISDNVIISVCFDRNTKSDISCEDVDIRTRMLCYADLLKYVYLQPAMTKSYSQTNDSWSVKEGATNITAEDKKKILEELAAIYDKYGEPESIPTPRVTVSFRSRGFRMFRS